MIAAFLEAESIDRGTIDRACFGVAGPVIDDAAELTNVPWRVEARAVANTFGLERVRVLNDLEAMAYAVPVLEDSELHTLQRGEPIRGGNISADRGRNRSRRSRCCTTWTAGSSRRRPRADMPISPPGPSARSRCCAI